jgi:large subunit ribosomal protein L2
MKKIKKNRLTLSKYKFLFKFLKRSLRKGGRNNYGRITVRAQGGGVKQLYRTVNFKRNFKNGVVSNLDYDPNRSAYLAKIISINEQEKGAISYILAPKGLKIFDRIQVIENKRKNYLLRPGDVSILANFEIGDFIHCVEMIKGRGGLFARAAGTFCQILENLSSFVKIKLPSGSRRLFSSQVKASYGVISRENYNLRILEKAGCNR